MRRGSIEQWRVLWWPTSDGPMPFLAGLTAIGPDPRPRPIITSYLVDGDVTQGETVMTHSGSLYELGDPLPENKPADFVRSLLRRRALDIVEIE